MMNTYLPGISLMSDLNINQFSCDISYWTRADIENKSKHFCTLGPLLDFSLIIDAGYIICQLALNNITFSWVPRGRCILNKIKNMKY